MRSNSGHWLYDTFEHTRELGEKDLNPVLALGDSLDVDLPWRGSRFATWLPGSGVPHRED